MRKKFILALLFASVLVGFPFTGANAAYTSAACWAGFCPALQQGDFDRPLTDYDIRGATGHGPTIPQPMGSPGF